MAPGEPSVVIAAGGTGGHIYPGLAVAEALRTLVPEARLAFLGTARGLERTLIPAAGHPLHLVDMVPFAGRGRALLPLALVRASLQARRVLRTEGADVAVGMGGYASIPLIAGARLAGVPSLIHESGAVPGRANLLAARLTRHVALAFASAAPAFPRRCELRTVGMPLGPGLARFDRDSLRPDARSALCVPTGTKLVLVNGGSQGARSLNDLALGLGRRWRGRDDVRILLKAGARHHDAVAAGIDAEGTGSVVTLTRFIERMDHAYAAADMAVCRAGAGTVAELAVVGLPAVLVPYPHATGDHQAHNAALLVEAGGAELVADGDATAERVGPLLEERLADPSALARMAAASRAAARPRAAEELAAWALELAGSER
jgi:UDP-N-acetylglucosamine--N-acetylmuramyl-(pentapeptide) pyrophosphoryl-undecaprenol N-acetylglucosamine transferase